MQPIRALAGQARPSEGTPDKLLTPVPQEAASLYLLGAAKVNALVGSAADHLDISGAWKRGRAAQGCPMLHRKLGNLLQGKHPTLLGSERFLLVGRPSKTQCVRQVGQSMGTRYEGTAGGTQVLRQRGYRKSCHRKQELRARDAAHWYNPCLTSSRPRHCKTNQNKCKLCM